MPVSMVGIIVAAMVARMLRISAGLQLVAAGLALVVIFGPVQGQVRDGLGEDGEAAAVVAGAVVGLVLALVFALLFFAVAGSAKRGGGAGRVVAASMCVLALVWTGGVLILNPSGGPLSLFAAGADTQAPIGAEEFQRRIDEALPDWYAPVHIGLSAVVILATLAALVLIVTRKRGA